MVSRPFAQHPFGLKQSVFLSVNHTSRGHKHYENAGEVLEGQF